MENQTRECSSYFSSIFEVYKRHFISNLEKINSIDKQIPLNNNRVIINNFIKEIKQPYLLFWGLITYNITNITGILKYFNVVKEKNFSLGETLENVIKTNSIKDLSFRNLFNFFSKSFYSMNGLIFRPGIMIPKTFIYLTGVFNFHLNERSDLKDYVYLIFSSFLLTIPFYYHMDGFLLNRLKFSRLEQNNIYYKNLYKKRLLSCSLYAFIDNFLLNMVFFKCLDLLEKFNEKTGVEFTYEKRKLEEVKNIGVENETLGRVLILNSSFIKRNYSSDKVYEYIFAGFITASVISPIETMYFIFRKNVFDVKMSLKNFNNLNEEGKFINAILLKKSFKMNLFRVFITNSLNCLLLLRSVERY